MTELQPHVVRHAERLQDASWLPDAGPFACFGQRWTIRTTHSALREFLIEAFAPLRVNPPDGAQFVVYRLLPPEDGKPGVVYRDNELINQRRSPAATLGSLIWAINRQVIERSLHRVILHAAAASLDGAVVVLPAPMESGKTTLVTGLLDRGWSYLTDEAAAVSGSGLVEGYAKPLSIDPGSWGVLAHHRPQVSSSLDPFLSNQWQVAVQDFASVTTSGPLRLLVFPRYEEGASTTVTPLTPASTVRALTPCTFAHEETTLGATRIQALASIAESVPAFELVNGSLAAACDSISRLLDDARDASSIQSEP